MHCISCISIAVVPDYTTILPSGQDIIFIIIYLRKWILIATVVGVSFVVLSSLADTEDHRQVEVDKQSLYAILDICMCDGRTTTTILL